MSARQRDFLVLLASVATPLAIGFLGSLTTTPSIPTWYRRLKKPAWTPPSWLFAPVWTALYTLMGTASWLVWKRGWDDPRVQVAENLYAAQLALNSMWSPVFFGLKELGAGLAILVALWATLLATTVQFFRVRPLAGLLLVPYLLWVSFAGALNASLWRLNR